MVWHRFESQQNHYKYCRMIFNEIFIQHARHKLPLFFCFCSIQHYCEVYMCICLCLFRLMLCILGKNFSRRYFEIYFLFLPENRFWHLMKIVSLHEMSEPVFWKKYHQFVVCWICPKSSESWYWTAIYSSVRAGKVLYLRPWWENQDFLFVDNQDLGQTAELCDLVDIFTGCQSE